MIQGTSDRVLELYGRALAGCARADAPAVGAALVALIDMLDFTEAPEIADGFHRLYTYCLQVSLQHRFAQAAWILTTLRDTWAAGAAARPAALAS